MNYDLTPDTSLLSRAIIEYHLKPENLQNTAKMIDMISLNSRINLRVIDWFVTKHHTIIHDGAVFDIRKSFLTNLRQFRRAFSPFRRGVTFSIELPVSSTENRSVLTCIDQLAFFKWAFEHGVIDYIELNYERLRDELNVLYQNQRYGSVGQLETTERFDDDDISECGTHCSIDTLAI